MRYTIKWIETHNPYNWGENYEEGRQNILDNLPNPKILRVDEDSWITVTCFDYFEAKDIKEAKQIVLEEYEVDTFAVFDEENKQVFSDCDFEGEE